MRNIRNQLGTRESLRTSTEGWAAPFATARTFLVLTTIFVWVQPVVWAGDDNNGGTFAEPAAATVTVEGTPGHQLAVKPFIHPAVAPEIRAKLEAGLELAMERVHEIETCRDLFAQLGADGLDMLNTGLYFQVDSHLREGQVCQRNGAANSQGADTLAYTKVGAASTWLCRHFARVSTETAAVAVIHEALHHAGLSEWPSDRLAMTSEEITRMVKKSCEF